MKLFKVNLSLKIRIVDSPPSPYPDDGCYSYAVDFHCNDGC